MGSGVGPRPIAGRKPDASSGGSSSSDAACNEVLRLVSDFVATYQQMENNARAKQEALDKVEILNERLRATQVSG